MAKELANDLENDIMTDAPEKQAWISRVWSKQRKLLALIESPAHLDNVPKHLLCDDSDLFVVRNFTGHNAGVVCSEQEKLLGELLRLARFIDQVFGTEFDRLKAWKKNQAKPRADDNHPVSEDEAKNAFLTNILWASKLQPLIQKVYCLYKATKLERDNNVHFPRAPEIMLLGIPANGH